MNLITNLYKLLKAPLEKHFYFFITVLLLHALVDVVFFYIYWRFSLQVLLNGLFLSYLLTLPCMWLARHKRIFRFYKVLVFVPYIISFVADIVAHAVLDSSLDEDVAATILATNKDEFVECVETYFSFLPLGIGVVILFVAYKLYKYLQTTTPKYVFMWMTGVVAGGLMTLTADPTAWGGVLGKAVIFYRAQSPIDLHTYNHVLDLKVDSVSQPQNIVMIIGESLTKFHCSSYGYEKRTTPRLEELIDNGLLYQFENVKSPEVHTLPVFKTLFSQYRCEWEDSVRWYTCPTLQSVLHASGYKTTWVSNQSKRGVCDNFIGSYAELCTENYFAGNKLAGMKRKTHDEVVVDLLKPLVQQDTLHNFYVVHLMGSHFKFAKRYPKEFDHYQMSDYPELPFSQQKVVATYDNSVLYNDSVVSEVMRLFENKEAIVFYFSDHAIDLYQSSSSYYGHAKKTKESFKWGQEIPFYIYMTPKYQDRFPEVVTAVKNHQQTNFCTDNMFYTIMDLIGADFVGNDNVKRYSLFE